MRSPSRLRRVAALTAVAAVLGLGTAGPIAASDEAAAIEYHVPFAAGVSVIVTQGWHGAYSHGGLAAYAYDFGLPLGTAVLASAAGTVTYTHAGEGTCGGADELLHANYVTLDHPDETATHYGHLSEVLVEPGQAVAAGQVIGRVGNTGFTNCESHLHFARQLQGGAVTQSVPVFFAESADRQLLPGDVVLGSLAALAAPLPVELTYVAEVELRMDVEVRRSVKDRMQAIRAAGFQDGLWPFVTAPEPHGTMGELEADLPP